MISSSEDALSNGNKGPNVSSVTKGFSGLHSTTQGGKKLPSSSLKLLEIFNLVDANLQRLRLTIEKNFGSFCHSLVDLFLQVDNQVSSCHWPHLSSRIHRISDLHFAQPVNQPFLEGIIMAFMDDKSLGRKADLSYESANFSLKLPQFAVLLLIASSIANLT